MKKVLPFACRSPWMFTHQSPTCSLLLVLIQFHRWILCMPYLGLWYLCAWWTAFFPHVFLMCGKLIYFPCHSTAFAKLWIFCVLATHFVCCVPQQTRDEGCTNHAKVAGEGNLILAWSKLLYLLIYVIWYIIYGLRSLNVLMIFIIGLYNWSKTYQSL